MSLIVPPQKLGFTPIRRKAMWSWGSNYVYGTGRTTGLQEEPNEITAAGNSNWYQMDAKGHGLAVTNTGKLYGWGAKSYFRMGDGSNSGNWSVPTQIGTDSDWKWVAAGQIQSFAIKKHSNGGTLWATGENYDGRLGLGDNVDRSVWTQIGAQTDWHRVYSSLTHVLALKTDGKLYAWGNNNFGKLGVGDTTNRNSPVRVGTATGWTSVRPGNNHSGGIKGGKVYVWGTNSFFATGYDQLYYSPHECTNRGTDNLKIVCGPNHSLILKNDQTVMATGYNPYYALGCGAGTTYITGFVPLATYGSNAERIQDIETSYRLTVAKKRSTTNGKNYVVTCGSEVRGGNPYVGIVGQGTSVSASYELFSTSPTISDIHFICSAVNNGFAIKTK